MAETIRSSTLYQSLPASNDTVDDLENEADSDPVGSLEPLILSYDEENSPLGVSRLVALTCSIGGLQVIWSVILSQGAPFLVYLGLSKSLTSLVWIAGPFCGAFVQPIMGYLSDKSKSKWGRRRPFIAAGALGTIVSIVMLAWTESSIKWLVRICKFDIEKEVVTNIIIAFAILWIYILNIAIQPLQVGLRALVVENCPSNQQAQANAWASFMTGGGNIFGYLVGFAPLPDFTDYQARFKVLCIIASLAVAITFPITSYFIHEKIPETMVHPPSQHSGLVTIARRLVRTFRTMPLRIRRVLQIQFFAWMGWFPYLFYATTYIGDLYSEAVPQSTMAKNQLPLESKRNTRARVGTFATFLSAVIALIANILLRFIVRPMEKHRKGRKLRTERKLIQRFTISQIWTLAHVSFAILMFFTLAVQTHVGGTVLIALSGISWAMTLWAPYAIIGQELAAKQAKEDEIGSAEINPADDSHAGLIMSLHNMAISLPQIVAALVCSGIFWVSKVTGIQDGAALCLQAGGFASLAAAWISSDFDEN